MSRSSHCSSVRQDLSAVLAGVVLSMVMACSGCADTGDVAAGAAQYLATQSAAFDADEVEDYLSVWDDSPFE